MKRMRIQQTLLVTFFHLITSRERGKLRHIVILDAGEVEPVPFKLVLEVVCGFSPNNINTRYDDATSFLTRHAILNDILSQFSQAKLFYAFSYKIQQ